MRRVVVTGIGMVTPLGATAAETASSFASGRAAAKSRLSDLEGTPLEASAAAVLPPFDPAARLQSRKMLKYMSGSALLGCIAAREAVESSGVKSRCRAERIGLFAGTGLAAADIGEVRRLIEGSTGENGSFSMRRFGENGLASTNPLISFHILANMPACLVSIMEGLKGPNYIFTPWEGQTGAALSEAVKAVASGEADAAVAGASDTPAHPAAFLHLWQAGLLGPGEFPASSAAYLVLEPEGSAPRSLGIVKEIRLGRGAKQRDPLADRMGRTFASAPAIYAALSCLAGLKASEISGCDGLSVMVDIEAAS